MPTRPEIALGRLQEMRRRRRGLRARTGLLRWLALGGALLWVSFLLDYSLSLPAGIRGFHMVAGLAILAVGFRILFLSARTPIPEDRLAAEVESAAGDLEQTLLTAVQLTREDNPRRHLYSPVLLARTVAEAERRTAGLVPGALLSRAKLGRAALVLALVFAPLVVGAALRPDLARTYVQRNLLLSQTEWPRAYLLRIVEPEVTESLLAVGDSLTVLAERDRGGGARARLEAYFRTAEGGETREELPLERRGDDSFRRIFRNVSRDFRFRVHCGDFTSRWYSVAVRNRPRVEEIALSFAYPEYTGMGRSGSSGEGSRDGAAPPTMTGGHLKVPVGTVVTYRARTSIPVREAVRVEARRSGDGEMTSEDAVPIESGTELAGSFPAEENGFYHFRLVSEDGFENPNPIRYRIAVIADSAPSVQILHPGRNLELSDHAQLELRLHLEDDYGIEEAEILFFREGEGDGGTEPLQRIPLSAVVPGTREFEPTWAVDLSTWSQEPGDRIEYRAEATDAIGQVGRSRTWLVTILSDEDISRILQDGVTLIRERLTETFELERETRRELEDIEERTTIAGGTVPEELRPNLRLARMNQERVNARMEEGVERFQEIIDRVRQNRIDDFAELSWVQELRDRLDGLTQEEGRRALDSLDELVREPDEGRPTSEDVAQAVEEVRNAERQLRTIVDELEEYGDLQTVIRKLEDLLRSQDEIESRIQDRVRETLGGSTPDGSTPDDGGGDGGGDGDDRR